MKIKVFSRLKVEQYKPGEKTVLISIRDSDSEKANIQKGWRGIMFLDFDDIDRQIGDLKLFSVNEANLILMFMEECVRILGKDITVVINCEEGIGRSAAIALVLERVYNEYDAYKQYPWATKKVFNVLMEVYYVYREKENEKRNP